MNDLLCITLLLLFGTLIKIVISTTLYNCSSSATCGCSTNSAILNKIVGGEDASSQTWGWAVSLRYSSSGSHFCGGSIISNLHILTAAHCATGLTTSSVRAYVGSVYLSGATQVRDVSKIYIHPSYSSSTYLNDIAILKLSSSLNLDANGVDLVCLPTVSSYVLASGEYPTSGTNLIAIGWGVLTEGSRYVSPTLQQVTIQSIASSNVYCRNVNLYDSSTQFCAGVMPLGGKDTCQGDSGGPLLMFNSNNVWEQVGITSVGYGCARASYPGIYTRVAAYQSWINATMNSAEQIFTISYKILIPILVLILF